MGVIIDPDLHGNVPYRGVQAGDYRKVCPKCGDWIWPIMKHPKLGVLYSIHICCPTCIKVLPEISEKDKEDLK